MNGPSATASSVKCPKGRGAAPHPSKHLRNAVTRGGERGHQARVMCEIPAEPDWSARFSPNGRSGPSPSYPLSTTKSVGYTPWRVWRATCTSRPGKRGDGMAVDLNTLAHKTWRTIASIQTGVVLLILVVILSA